VAAANFTRLTIKQPKPGDTRKIRRTFDKDDVLSFDKDPEKYRLLCKITMDVTEEYQSGEWCLKNYFTESAEPVPTRWERFKVWLMGPSLPVAKVIKDEL
jgi:hypothetical protein